MNVVFKALNDPTRRKILDLLKDRDMTAGEIAGRFNVSWPTISHHLELLQHAGLVTTLKRARFIIYSINATVLTEISKWIIEIINTSNQHETS